MKVAIIACRIMDNRLRICVIGAGTAGLSALKHSLESNLNATCYEQVNDLGGTWLYQSVDRNVCNDDDVHSSLYDDLRTNLPKEIMGYPDFHYSLDNNESFIKSEDVWKFLNSYAEHFQLRPFIYLRHEVILVRPRSKQSWEVNVYNHDSGKLLVEHFDRIFICNGHYSKPKYPKINGMELFQGQQMHSHLYRNAKEFQNQNVLIVGGGRSAFELVCQISLTAKRVLISHHLRTAPNTNFLMNVNQKPDIKTLTKYGALFKDDTIETFEHIIYCTGYEYSLPFLSSDCAIQVHNHVWPLYKHCLNIVYPTMAIIGLPELILPTQLFDLQVRFVLKYFINLNLLPNHKTMMDDCRNDMKQQLAKGLKEYHMHQLGDKQKDYYKDLADKAHINNIKPVLLKILNECEQKYVHELQTYRCYQYEIIDDEHYRVNKM